MALRTAQEFLQHMVKFSHSLVPGLVEEGRRIGKAPFCVDGMAENMAAQILGPCYPRETHPEYLRRTSQIRQCDCRQCR
jgi:hypothetical protein